MDLALALKLFDVNAYSVNSIKEGDLRKKYRELIKLNHPDNHSREDYLRMDEIQEARDLIIEFIKSPIVRTVRPIEKDILDISVEDLIRVYENRIYNGIDLSKIVRSDTFVSFDYSIKSEKEEYKFISKTRFNREDNYSIIKESDLRFSLGDKLDIALAGNVKSLMVNGSCIRVAFNLDKNIKVDLSLYVKLN
jgi:hypothetical protein